MKTYAVLGAGMMGKIIAKDLIDSEQDAVVNLFDIHSELLHTAEKFINSDRLTIRHLDITCSDKAVAALAGNTAAVSALPHELSLPAIKAAIGAHVSLVDLVGEAPEERAALHERALQAGCLIIPGLGVAPGISNLCVGRGIELLDETENAYIYVGGIPVRKEPPLYYQTVYLLESVFNAYMRPVKIIDNGKHVVVEPLTGLENVPFTEPIGVLEGFFTDGLGSLTLTVGEKIGKTMFEKTLRYPGFADRISFLKQCGFMDKTPVSVGMSNVVPLALLIRLLEKRLQLSPEGDILAMRIIVEGMKDGRRRKHVFELVDYLDHATQYTAMARTTGFPAACAARMIAAGQFSERGVFFPEQLFSGDRFSVFIAELTAKGVKISHSESG